MMEFPILVLVGAFGVPFGTWMLPHVAIEAFKAGVGVLLIVVCGFLLMRGQEFRLRWGGRGAYNKLDIRAFEKVVLVLLLAGGVATLVTALP